MRPWGVHGREDSLGNNSSPSTHTNRNQVDGQGKTTWKEQGMNAADRCITFTGSTKMTVLIILCLQNSLFTVLRRYSQGVLQESYSKHEVLLVGEIIKIAFSAWMISKDLPQDCLNLRTHLKYLFSTSRKMYILHT